MKTSVAFLLGILTIFVLALLLPNYFFPYDLLKNLPSFNEDGWERPKNSLLADPVFQFEPWRHYAKERIGKGEFPLWNNLNGNGVPFFANPQTAVFFPLNFIYYIFPVKFSLYFIPFLKLYLLGFFSYLYLKSLKCFSSVCFFGAVGIVFAGFSMVWWQWPHVNVFMFFPLILFITEKLHSIKENAHRFYVLLAIVYLIAILGGHPETLFQIVTIHLPYLFFRFWKTKRRIIPIVLSIAFGFLLGSISLLPFIEYLLQSSILENRLLEKTLYLPLGSFLLNFVPFLLGAPHLEFYRPFNFQTNFQETIGGYTGPSILITALIGVVLFFKKDINIRFWTILTIILWLVSYGIWPMSFIGSLPIFSVSANNRLIGFAGFGLAVIFSLAIQRLIKKDLLTADLYKKWFGIGVRLLFLLTLAIIFSTYFLRFNETLKLIHFLSFLKAHILYMIMTTFLFLGMLFFPLKTGNLRAIKFFLLIIIVLFQTAVLFFGYNPIIKKDDYYPKTNLIKFLQALPRGPILEVGNPSLPADINLIFGLESSQGNDSLGIKSYKNAFDKAFPIKNQWGSVDRVDPGSLKSFGIRYLISDYNLNLTQDIIYSAKNTRLKPLDKNHPLLVEFKANSNYIGGIRVLTANFNRLNTCALYFKIKNKITLKEVASKNASCLDIRDWMYYAVDFPKVSLDGGKDYILAIGSDDASEQNSISLWGDKNNVPFVELFYEPNDKKDFYKLLYKSKNNYLWEVPDYKKFELDGSYSLLFEKPEEVQLLVKAEKPTDLLVKKTYYPGWEAEIDGRKVKLEKINPFMILGIPQGEHLVKIVYRPASFLLGMGITALTFLILFVYFIRQEKKKIFWKKFCKKTDNLAFKIRKNISWWQHATVFLIGIITSVGLFTIIVKLINFQFKMPYATAINWNTAYQYPKQQDYFYFFLGFPFVLIATLIIWIFWLWKKIKNT